MHRHPWKSACRCDGGHFFFRPSAGPPPPTWFGIHVPLPPWELSPQSFVKYLEITWLPERYKKMWSNVYRQGRNIHEDIDTNMLLEAWHHVLKGKYLHGKRNHRLDHLLHCLVNEVIPHYKLKQSRRELGLQGANLEVSARKEVAKLAAEQYTQTSITIFNYCSILH
ncbi:uncharacterized protein LACBIDRAFT_304748 [Laccaria bicolor S238N-H82]|uniref:Predicted protein n=1 Tax=Laccaria bicolor (strain S238N-H82 / ATCC MYA-4686) TaxID=486041 RepID=B0DM86_LACBS|nr:uncharacterized protein LACBIDRAFT_304748 [Laccaria bicolor S238N-H82]EDR04153.1 predicted protein [Laccaria bicolor S238N-H82]|eukprot:XP_001885044.1 predicted protein [Laccaria bicolor S238N-H82]